MKCAVSGTIPADQRQKLEDALVCLSGAKPRSIHTHEVCFRGSKQATVLLSRTLSNNAAAATWNAICYGLPLRGKQVAHLKATVRSITESSCSGTDIPAFLKDLGLTHQYQLVRRGQGFELVTKTNDVVQVTVSRLYRIKSLPDSFAYDDDRCRWELEEVIPNLELVEASIVCPEDAYEAGCAVLEDISQLLARYTILEPLPQPGMRRP